jgi:hypothetical protein
MCVEAVEKGMSLSVISNKIGADWCIILRSLALEGMAPQAVTDKTSVQELEVPRGVLRILRFSSEGE